MWASGPPGHSGSHASDGFLLQAGAKARQKRSRFIDDIAAVDTDEEEDEEDVSVPLVLVLTCCRFGYAWHAIWQRSTAPAKVDQTHA